MCSSVCCNIYTILNLCCHGCVTSSDASTRPPSVSLPGVAACFCLLCKIYFGVIGFCMEWKNTDIHFIWHSFQQVPKNNICLHSSDISLLVTCVHFEESGKVMLVESPCREGVGVDGWFNKTLDLKTGDLCTYQVDRFLKKNLNNMIKTFNPNHNVSPNLTKWSL